MREPASEGGVGRGRPDCEDPAGSECCLGCCKPARGIEALVARVGEAVGAIVDVEQDCVVGFVGLGDQRRDIELRDAYARIVEA